MLMTEKTQVHILTNITTLVCNMIINIINTK